MKKLIFFKLKIFAKLILWRYKPKVISITGSVGKTTTKEAIYVALKGKMRVRKSEKNYNNELGVPLTIIDYTAPGRDIFKWIFLGLKAWKLIIFKDKNYPEVLILEMGIDRPGDMDYLNSIVKTDIGVATTVGDVHMEYFGNKVKLQKEKSKLIEAVDKNGWSIVNFDDAETKKMISKSKAKVISFGFDSRAMLRADNLVLSYAGDTGKVQGLSFKMFYDGASVPVHLPNALGSGMVYSALAAAAVGVSFGMNMIELSVALKEFKSPKGRLNLVPGIKNTIIIDDTYNAEPKSAKLAIEVLSKIETRNGEKKLAALGDMLELGNVSVERHREIGGLLVEAGVNVVFSVGERARDIVRGAKEAGISEDRCFMFDNSDEAGKFIQNRIKQGDILLVKGSQGMRMEKIVLELMAEPTRAKELLVRQDKSWEGR